MKIVSENESCPKDDRNSRIPAELGKEIIETQELNNVNIRGSCSNLDQRNYKRVNSYDPPTVHKSFPFGSPVSIRRRYSFASGTSPYLDHSRRKYSSHNLIHNCGRRILKAVEEDKILTHLCERSLGGGTSPSLESYRSDNIVSGTILQNNTDNCSELGSLCLATDDNALISTESVSTKPTFRIIRRESLREFDTPFKVYSKKNSSCSNIPTPRLLKKENPFFELQNDAYRSDRYLKIMNAKNSESCLPTSEISSFPAIRIALSKLYNLEDFHTDKIGEGFFSEVFKVR
jgi:hypothetical protein